LVLGVRREKGTSQRTQRDKEAKKEVGGICGPPINGEVCAKMRIEAHQKLGMWRNAGRKDENNFY
jgi:hypothetical protein